LKWLGIELNLLLLIECIFNLLFLTKNLKIINLKPTIIVFLSVTLSEIMDYYENVGKKIMEELNSQKT